MQPAVVRVHQSPMCPPEQNALSFVLQSLLSQNRGFPSFEPDSKRTVLPAAHNVGHYLPLSNALNYALLPCHKPESKRTVLPAAHNVLHYSSLPQDLGYVLCPGRYGPDQSLMGPAVQSFSHLVLFPLLVPESNMRKRKGEGGEAGGDNKKSQSLGEAMGAARLAVPFDSNSPIDGKAPSLGEVPVQTHMP